ncbi:MAG: DUF2793 domain-containing protein [Rhizobiaceae bacterium]
MSEITHHLELPYIMPSQAQKHVTHNEALRMLDAIVQLSVLAVGTNDAPLSPADGERYVIGDTPVSPWDEKSNQIAAFIDGAWMYFQPVEGWLTWNQANSEMLVYSGETWQPIESGVSETMFLGINGQASDQERFVVQSQSVLFNHEGSDHRMKLNKSAASDTASLLFQNGFSGRAEFGIPGEDNFLVKVSDDGSNWHDAIRLDADSGLAGFPASGVELSESLFNNLLPDSGRFNSPGSQNALTSFVPEAPSYISSFNNAAISFPFKFIHNNDTFGGSVGVLDPTVEDLIATIFGPLGLRYGPEFWCMQIDAGSGTGSSITVDGEVYYRGTIVPASPRPAKFTTGFFVKAGSGKVTLKSTTGQSNKLLRNGSPASYNTSDAVVESADGWVYFEMQVSRASLSYEQNDMALMLLPGATAYFALPRVVPGWLTIGADKAIITNDRVFGS